MKNKILVIFLITFGSVSLLVLSIILVNKAGQKKPITPLSPTITPYPPLTIERIFNQSLTANNFGKSPGDVLLVVTGDIIPARSVNFLMVKNNNFRLPFEKTVDLLKKGDIVFANFESPIIKNCQATNEGMVFCGSEKAVEGLTFAGINVVSLANNHMGNYGQKGIDSTVDILKANNIEVAGNLKPAFKKIRGKTFAFLGYNTIGYKEDGLDWVEDNNYRLAIDNVRSQSDFLIVMLHWGDEYTARPNETQIKIAHSVIDAGADLVVGSHPHWVQGIEIYKNKLITYSLGNFIFDQMWSQETREGVIGVYTFDDKQLINASFIPVIIENYNQPRPVSTGEAKIILNRMKNASL